MSDIYIAVYTNALISVTIAENGDTRGKEEKKGVGAVEGKAGGVCFCSHVGDRYFSTERWIDGQGLSRDDSRGGFHICVGLSCDSVPFCTCATCVFLEEARHAPFGRKPEKCNGLTFTNSFFNS
jgi:hypothetical protein